MSFISERKYNGYKLVNEINIAEINSNVQTFKHCESGANLLFLNNNDSNKVFSLTLKTPSLNNKGIIHLLEHAVLCGSRKHPSRNSYQNIINNSLNNFVNALTYIDKTVFVASSIYETSINDFIDYFINAAFYPQIYENRKIFDQEGWHYELEHKEGEIAIKGVVYNEMNGLYSSPEAMLKRKIQTTLFPDTSYGYEQGGNPDVIPTLTYDEFINYHKIYYHPSNSFLFFYGDYNVPNQLERLDTLYLSSFNKNDIKSATLLQQSFNKQKIVKLEYSISDKEIENNNTYLALNYVIGTSIDAELCLSFEILHHYFMSTSVAPLKSNLLKAGICRSVISQFESSILQPYFSIILRNTGNDLYAEFLNIVYKTFYNEVTHGIDINLMIASINYIEFKLKENNYYTYPKGFAYNLSVLKSWIYEGNPIAHLNYSEIIKKIKMQLKNGYFEQMIIKYLLNNTHSSLIILEPKKKLEEEKRNLLMTRLNNYKSNLNDEQLNALINQTQEHKRIISSLDSNDNILPHISNLTETEDVFKKLPIDTFNYNNTKVLYSFLGINDIIYINLYFDTKKISQDNISYLALFCDILANVDTLNFKFNDLAREISYNTGGIKASLQVYPNNIDSGFKTKLIIKSSALIEKLPILINLLIDISANTIDISDNRLKDILYRIKSAMEMKITKDGYIYAYKRLISYFSDIGYFSEKASGISHYKFILDLINNYEQKKYEAIDELKKIAKRVLSRDTLTIGITCNNKYYKVIEKHLKYLINCLPIESYRDNNIFFVENLSNEGIISKSSVQAVALGFNFKKLGYEYSGKLDVLSTILKNDYLFNKIRLTGGAYDVLSHFDREGNAFFVTHHDSNITDTLKSYMGIEKYLQNFNISKSEIDRHIIGTMNKLSAPLSSSMLGSKAQEYHFRNITYDELCEEKNQILSTKREDIVNYSSLIFDLLKKNRFCVVGSYIEIQKNQFLFNKVEYL